MLKTELIIICGDYILLDDGKLPSLEINEEAAEDNAKTLMQIYLGLSENWYTTVQCGYFDDEFINNERIKSVLYLTAIPERMPLKCNLASWANLSEVSDKKTFNKLAFAIKMTLPTQKPDQ